MKHLLSLLILVLLFITCTNTKTEQTLRPDATFDGYSERLKSDPVFAGQVKDIDIKVHDFLKGNHILGAAGIFSGTITIPVVVHIVHNPATPAENVTDAVVFDQIAALNRDFRMTNAAEIAALPPAFQALAADSRIQFVLAKRDPSCVATTGIVRQTTNRAGFPYAPGAGSPQLRNPVKFSGGIALGHDRWRPTQPDEYLNIWVCNLSSTTGYASLPADLGARLSEDGVVVDYRSFGNSTNSPKGRTCTNLVAKWLGLMDIWGPAASGCVDSDFSAADAPFDDTPNQDDMNTGCPMGVQVSCPDAPDGDNYQNFMDGTNDDCRVMFTAGQADKMGALLATTRASLLSSNAGTAPAPTARLWIKDTNTDLGNEANLESTVFYQSDDIWVRVTNDGLTNQEHQNAKSASPNFVYVRVRNPGCTAVTATSVKLYWAKASSSLNWPSPWNGSVPGPPSMGGLVGTMTTSAIAGSTSEILVFPWTAPDVSLYPSPDAGHFCLLAEVQNNGAFSTLVDMPGDLIGYAKQNREVAWKNIGVTADGGSNATSGGGAGVAFSSVIVGNFGQGPTESKLQFKSLANEASVFDYGKIYVKGKLVQNWVDGGKQGNNVRLEGDSIIIEKDGASLEGIKLLPNEFHSLMVGYDRSPQASVQRQVYKLNLEQFQKQNNDYQLIGGQIFVLKSEARPPNPDGTKGDGDKDGGRPWWQYLVAVLALVLAFWAWRRKK